MVELKLTDDAGKTLPWDDQAAGSLLTQTDLAGHLKTRVPGWWLPDVVVFADALPHTATRKIHQRLLREQYARMLLAQRR